MRAAVLGLMCAVACAAPALAQQPKPLQAFVFDIRGAFPSPGKDATTAADLGVQAADMPGRGFGPAFGAHVFFWRSNGLALGFGVEGLMARSQSALVSERMEGVAGVFSLNFGHREGWSYVSAGAGPLRFRSELRAASPAGRPHSKMIVNVGGGARWFTTPHLAFTVDARLYLAKAITATDTWPGRGKKNLLTVSVGISIK
jgi:hypothetical protein